MRTFTVFFGLTVLAVSSTTAAVVASSRAGGCSLDLSDLEINAQKSATVQVPGTMAEAFARYKAAWDSNDLMNHVTGHDENSGVQTNGNSVSVTAGQSTLTVENQQFDDNGMCHSGILKEAMTGPDRALQYRADMKITNVDGKSATLTIELGNCGPQAGYTQNQVDRDCDGISELQANMFFQLIACYFENASDDGVLSCVQGVNSAPQ